MKSFNEITSFPPPLPFCHSHYLFHPISPLFSIQNTLNIACQIVLYAEIDTNLAAATLVLRVL